MSTHGTGWFRAREEGTAPTWSSDPVDQVTDDSGHSYAVGNLAEGYTHIYGDRLPPGFSYTHPNLIAAIGIEEGTYDFTDKIIAYSGGLTTPAASFTWTITTSDIEITTQPEDAEPIEPLGTTFTCIATHPGGSSVLYEWFASTNGTDWVSPSELLNNVQASTITQSTLRIWSSDISEDGVLLRCTVSLDGELSTIDSNTATLLPQRPVATFTQQPTDTTGAVGSNTFFSASATHPTQRVHYAWQAETSPGNNTWTGVATVFPGRVAGDFSENFTLLNTQSEDGRLIRCRARVYDQNVDTWASHSNEVELTVEVGEGSEPNWHTDIPTQIDSEDDLPVSIPLDTYCSNADSFVSMGPGVITDRRFGFPVGTDIGVYECQVLALGEGSSTSNIFDWQIAGNAPVIEEHPEDSTVEEPAGTSFTVGASHIGDAQLFYEWEARVPGGSWRDPSQVFSDVQTSSITTSTLVLRSTSTDDSGQPPGGDDGDVIFGTNFKNDAGVYYGGGSLPIDSPFEGWDSIHSRSATDDSAGSLMYAVDTGNPNGNGPFLRMTHGKQYQPLTRLDKHLTGDHTTGYDRVFVRFRVRFPPNFRRGGPDVASAHWKHGRLWQNTYKRGHPNASDTTTENRADSGYCVWTFGGDMKQGYDSRGATWGSPYNGRGTAGSSGGQRFRESYWQSGENDGATLHNRFQHIGAMELGERGKYDQIQNSDNDTNNLGFFKDREAASADWHTIQWEFQLASGTTDNPVQDGVSRFWVDGYEHATEMYEFESRNSGPTWHPDDGPDGPFTGKHHINRNGSGFNFFSAYDNLAHWNHHWEDDDVDGWWDVADIVISREFIPEEYYPDGVIDNTGVGATGLATDPMVTFQPKPSVTMTVGQQFQMSCAASSRTPVTALEWEFNIDSDGSGSWLTMDEALDGPWSNKVVTHLARGQGSELRILNANLDIDATCSYRCRFFGPFGEIVTNVARLEVVA